MIRVLIAGDYCPQDRIAKMIDKKDYSFFSDIRQLTNRADYSIVNLECPVADDKCTPIQKSGPCHKCKPDAIDAIKEAGFRGVTLANNHLRDYGEKGVLTTLSTLDAKGMDRVGGGDSLNNSKKPLIKLINGKKLVFINYCESEFSIASDYSAGAAPMDLIDIQRELALCKAFADYVIIIVHGGTEMRQLPSPLMQKTYRWFVDLGADAVVNHHQHCYSGFEVYHGKPIFYGLGNFCFDKPSMRDSIWNDGYMVQINLDNDISFDIVPYQQCNYSSKVLLKKGDELCEFNHSIALLNNIISDPLLVEVEFERFSNGFKNNILGLFSPYTNRYLRGAAQKGFLPFFLPKKKLARIYDYIRCETHRDITLRCLHDLL